jgi:hypothetical protein
MYSGSNEILIESGRKLNSPQKGYSKVLDQKMPFVSNSKLNIGIDADVMFSIRCNKSGHWIIAREDFENLEKIFHSGPKLIKLYFEKIISQIKSKLVSNNRDPLFVYSLIDSVFPEMLRLVQDQLSLLNQQYPYLDFSITGTTNISNILDGLLQRNQELLGNAWLQTATAQLQSAYDPETEFSERAQHYERLSRMLPTPTPPTNEDIAKALEIIERERLSLRNQQRLGFLGDSPKLKSGN